MQEFSTLITNWYHKNLRYLPWRDTQNPYLIWLSEILLQQTRVEQGLPYYQRFSTAYPDVTSLASASEQEILRLWQGLGYYSRARNLHAAAKTIRDEFGGQFPSTYVQIRKLKGVGDYTAAAISSFAFGLPHAVVDGNVYRLLSRYFGLYTPINSPKGRKEFAQLAEKLLDKKHPGIYNQAIMEFGSVQCSPKNPDCTSCPLSKSCFAYLKKQVKMLPVKTKKVSVRNRYFEYLVAGSDNTLYMKKREGKDIWQHMYDFPYLEFDRKLEIEQVAESEEWKAYFGMKKVELKKVSHTVKHILSHQIIHARFWELKTPSTLTAKGIVKIPSNKVNLYPIPRLIDKYLKEKV